MEIVDILGQLIPNVWTAITQLCATAVLFFLMYKLAWKPVKNILDARSAYEQSKLEEAESLRIENEKLNAEAKESIEKATVEADNILTTAKEEAEEMRKQLLKEAEEDKEKMMESARHEIDLQRNKMMDDMHDEIVDVAVSVAEKMLQTKINTQSEKDSIDAYIKELVKK